MTRRVARSALPVRMAMLASAMLLLAAPALAQAPCAKPNDAACADQTFDPQPGIDDAAPGMLAPPQTDGAAVGAPPPAAAFKPRPVMPEMSAEPPPPPSPPAKPDKTNPDGN